MNHLSSIYNESRTKQNTRQIILKTALKMFKANEIANTSMQDIAQESEITVRNLYRYYPSKELLAIDVAYYYFTEVVSQEHIPAALRETGIESLEEILRNYPGIPADRKHYDSDSFRFLTHLDFFLAALDESDPVFIRYTREYVPTFFTKLNNMLALALTQGITDGTIKIDFDEIEHYIEYITQTTLSVLMRISIKEKERPRTNISLYHLHIDMIIHYLKTRSKDRSSD